MQRTLPFAAPALAAALAASGCARPQAYGDVNSIIVAAPGGVWDSIADTLYSALEPRIFTVRDERTFEVTPIDPRDAPWTRLRQWKQVLVFGTADDPWMEEPLDAADGPSVKARPPAILQARDVWARGQSVTAVLLPAAGGAEAARQVMEPLHELLDAQFWEYAQQRMFITGADTVLAQRLAEEAGFRITLPVVYKASQKDSIYLFRNDNPSPAELIRSVLVTWRTPPPDTVRTPYVLDWRRSIVAAAYDPAQLLDTARIESGWLRMDGRRAFQVQAVWVNPPELGWPAGGLFLTRIVLCPEQARAYLLDAWLYAPGKAKYEYMIQLTTILDSFRCEA